MSLTKNQWGFSVANDNPFAIFPYLQNIARASVGQASMIDLSRGDPGYGFTPSQAGREFFGYLMTLDSHLNNRDNRFISYNEKTWSDIQNWTQQYFSGRFDWIIAQWGKIFLAFEKVGATRGEVLAAFFYNCVISGGSYLDPAGQPLFRAFVAAYHQQFMEQKIDAQDIVFTNGASHAIGSLFKLFGEEGLGYLQKSDQVMIASPVYSPYNSILENRGLRPFAFSLHPVTGEVRERSLRNLDSQKEKIKMVVLIDPNNPTGTSSSEEFLHKLAAFAEKNDSIIITDEVYSDFFPRKKTIIDLCPKRVLRIHARSKIERSTGLRFGDLIVAPEAQKYLGNKFGVDIIQQFVNAKGPGGAHGEFFHTTFVSGPAQVLGILHMILGTEDREHCLNNMKIARDSFYQTLSLPHKNNMYYSIFDLNEIPGCKRQSASIEEKMSSLAKLGVIYIPAYRFFDEEDRAEKDLFHTVRASFVNATPEKVKKAAEITKQYLCG